MRIYLFPQDKEIKEEKPNLCPKCKSSTLSIKMRKNGSGPFVACASHPNCNYIRSNVFPDEESQDTLIEDKVLGKNTNNIEVLLKKGPYGPYVQLGNDIDKKDKVRRASIPKNFKTDDISLEIAIKLLALPRDIGLHPETGEMIIANNGRYGPYLKYNNTFYSIPKDEDPLTIGINRAVDILSKPKKKSARTAVKPLKIIGKHPKDKEEILLYKGKYGFYLKYKNINYGLPKSVNSEELSVEDSLKVIIKKNKGSS